VQAYDVRAGDTDRERVVAALQQHVAAGRLTMDGYSTRTEAAYAARTVGELGGRIADLPALDPDSAVAHHNPRRGSLMPAGLAAVAGLAGLVYLGPLVGGSCCSW
jgi:hypothetical protein